MGSQSPVARFTGTWLFWTAAANTAEPAIDDAILTGWTAIARTDGDQTLRWTGNLVGGSDNSHNAMVIHLRPDQGFEVVLNMIHLTLAQMARGLGIDPAQVIETTSGGENVRVLPIERDYIPQRFALLGRGGALPVTNVMSTEAASKPAQLWIPQGVFDSAPEITFNKPNTGVTLNTTFKAEFDETQAVGASMGRILMAY